MTPQPSQKGCCDKCWDTQDGTGIRFCSNPQCECHQKQCSRCLKTISTEDGTTHTCKLADGEAPTGDWEKEFDEKFIDEGMLYQAAGEENTYVSASFTVKEYIRSLLTRVREEGYWSGAHDAENGRYGQPAFHRAEGARAAREEILNKLQEKYEELERSSRYDEAGAVSLCIAAINNLSKSNGA